MRDPRRRDRAADRRRSDGRHARRVQLDRLGGADPSRVRGGALGLLPAGARTAGPLTHPRHGSRDPSAARPDLAALHLQLAHGDRLVRADRSAAGAGAAAGVRRLHPLLLPPRWLDDHARRGTAVHRLLLPAGAGTLRRPAATRRAGGAGNPRTRDAVPVLAATRGERGTPWTAW